MSRSSAKERGRVQDGGRHIDTFRTVENFGSWKHEFYLPNDCPSLIPLSRRFIGGKNSGRKLAISVRTIQIRKPTDRMIEKFRKELWAGTEFKLATVRTGSNYPNRKKIRQAAKKMATSEMTAHLEEQRERLELERQEEIGRAMEQNEIQRYFAEQERSAELANLSVNLALARNSLTEQWGYHHFF